MKCWQFLKGKSDFGSIQIDGIWRRITNEELYRTFKKSDIINFISTLD